MGISPTQAAARLGVSRQRVNALIHEGRIKAERLGARTWIVDEGSVEQYAATRKEEGRPEAA